MGDRTIRGGGAPNLGIGRARRWKRGSAGSPTVRPLWLRRSRRACAAPPWSPRAPCLCEARCPTDVSLLSNAIGDAPFRHESRTPGPGRSEEVIDGVARNWLDGLERTKLRRRLVISGRSALGTTDSRCRRGVGGPTATPSRLTPAQTPATQSVRKPTHVAVQGRRVLGGSAPPRSALAHQHAVSVAVRRVPISGPGAYEERRGTRTKTAD